MPSCGCSLVVLHKEPKALIIVGTSCKLAPARGLTKRLYGKLTMLINELDIMKARICPAVGARL